jgi:hypothetical protein
MVVDVDRSARIVTVAAVLYEQPADVVFRGQVWREVFTRGAFSGIEQRVAG